MLGIRRTRTSADIPAVSGSRPVMLVTFDVPFEPEATELAVDAAVESGQRLIIVNVAEVPLGPISLAMKYEYVGTAGGRGRAPRAGRARGLARRRGRAAAPLQPAARSRRCSSSSPSARRGSSSSAPTASGSSGARYAKLTKRIRERAACLVWLPA